MTRTANVKHQTAETQVRIDLDIDGSGIVDVTTGVAFFDHLLSSLGHHALFDLTISTVGDLDVDDHHTVEDTALCLGSALSAALGDRSGITRFGDAVVPMDESRCQATVDLGGRSYAIVELDFRQPTLGLLSTQNIAHAIEAFSRTAATTLHVVGTGTNDHHLAESAFKALAVALRRAVTSEPRRVGPASTKGSL